MAIDEVQQSKTKPTQHPAFRRFAILVLALAAIAGLTGLVQPGLGQPAVAQAFTFQGPDRVGFGRAVVLFSREETRAIGQSKLKLPGTNPAFIAFNIASAGIAGIARNYYDRGLCSAYAWSVRPWDNQGFMSRRC
ncbi:hypothetical protein AFM11_35305 [Mycolicibacterium wolinskyi]|uniref:Uncharacterized protein n=1 Tax=Mycolicibacterium wolinskyi TaxID=59750 RepID=A0A132PB65_9MYCO|nr:hypothetical protein [Mycolicibacterium wolinskyi]KWX19558.1 hypothetical protein AFM11_35305 [Mycolicibacterium wolinskyi]